MVNSECAKILPYLYNTAVNRLQTELRMYIFLKLKTSNRISIPISRTLLPAPP